MRHLLVSHPASELKKLSLTIRMQSLSSAKAVAGLDKLSVTVHADFSARRQKRVPQLCRASPAFNGPENAAPDAGWRAGRNGKGRRVRTSFDFDRHRRPIRNRCF